MFEIQLIYYVHGLLQKRDISNSFFERRLVKNLLDEYKNVGYYLISMSAKHFTSGVYFLRYNNNDYQQEIKLIIQ
ncbi:MAG: hypothetical protein N2201_06450 [candidate division WOR-3 bacterium]|nr:hypothetical protein [candidate division WOR-3 bacterium]